MRLSLSIAHPACVVALLAISICAWAGCGSGTPLGGPYGGTTKPTAPNTENTSEPGEGGSSGSSNAGADH